MSVLDTSPFPFGDAKAQQLWRVLAGNYGSVNSAMVFATPFGVDPLGIPPAPAPLDLWHHLLVELARLGKVRAAARAMRDQFPNNQHVPFLDALLAEQSAPIAFVGQFDLGPFDPYELVDQFDRVNESDQLAQALLDHAPPPLKPIVIGILAERSDEYLYFIRRINSEILKSYYQGAQWSDDLINWGETATAEFEFRKIARDKNLNVLGKIDDLIPKLGQAIAGRAMFVEIRSDLLQQPEMRTKLEEFLSLWARLGDCSPPLVLYVVVVRLGEGHPSLAEAEAYTTALFERIGDQLIAVKPVMLSLCDESNFDRWEYLIRRMGKKIDRKAYNELKSKIGNGKFRLRDLVVHLESIRVFL